MVVLVLYECPRIQTLGNRVNIASRFLEAVMNLLRSGLLMRKTGDRQGIEPIENPRSDEVFQPSS
jgi:hypothetical protein